MEVEESAHAMRLAVDEGVGPRLVVDYTAMFEAFS